MPRHQSGLGGTQIVWNALRSGGIDAYVEYTGTLGQEILGGKARSEEQMRAAAPRAGRSA